jgi:2-polyprenyl-6-methoxyphenol hydroxylase-like FAD-dependent oxidoreductase
MAERRVEIAGAGLAGLAVAVRLAQLGWKVRMHERNPELRMFGAGIWLWENGLKSLRILGAYEAATRRAKAIREWRICDPHGKVLMSRMMTPGDGMLLPPRADLYQSLIDRAQEAGVEIETSSVVTDVSPDGRITLQNGKEYPADLVIAADGAYSRLREVILKTRWIDYGVETGIRMLIRYHPGDSDDTCTEYWNGPWRLLYNPCTDGENYIFLSAPVNDERARALPIDRALWRSIFPDASDLISRFSEASRWDRIVNVRCSRWSSGRVALLGDAAHAMPPNLGQAANMAFTNAMALAMAVTEGRDVPGSLEAWERKQRPLSDHVQWWSYIYGLVVGCWPNSLLPLRSDLVRFLAKTEWFEHGLNRGARTVPDGFTAGPPGGVDVLAAASWSKLGAATPPR